MRHLAGIISPWHLGRELRAFYLALGGRKGESHPKIDSRHCLPPAPHPLYCKPRPQIARDGKRFCKGPSAVVCLTFFFFLDSSPFSELLMSDPSRVHVPHVLSLSYFLRSLVAAGFQNRSSHAWPPGIVSARTRCLLGRHASARCRPPPKIFHFNWRLQTAARSAPPLKQGFQSPLFTAEVQHSSWRKIKIPRHGLIQPWPAERGLSRVLYPPS